MARRVVYLIGENLEIAALSSGDVAVGIGSNTSTILTRDEALEAAVALLSGWADTPAWDGARNGIYPGRHANALRRYLGLGAASGDQ